MPEQKPRRFDKSLWVVLPLVVVLLLALAGGFYAFVLPGLSVARQEPPAIEIRIATWLLRHSVPDADRARRNPLAKDAASISAGKDTYTRKCEVCHAYEGGGKTEIGANVYPRPPVLRELVPALTDGEIFYHIRNGIRNTAMPAWDFPDRQIWQVVAYLRHLPIVAALNGSGDTATLETAPGAHFLDEHIAIPEESARTRTGPPGNHGAPDADLAGC